MNRILRCQSLEKVYGTGDGRIMAVADATFDFCIGVFYAIIGRSGCGKSTLLRILGGIEAPTKGVVRYKDLDIYKTTDSQLSLFRSQRFGFVFQSYNLIPELTAFDNIALPSRRIKADSKKTIEQLADALDLKDKLYAYPDELSGGQQQRVALARAFINRPDIIFADEPTGNLDRQNRDAVIDILRNYCKNNQKTIIMVSHDESTLKHADVILRMSEGVLSK